MTTTTQTASTETTSNEVADYFLELFESDCSVEIDGDFLRYFNEEVHSTSGDPDECVVNFFIDGQVEVFITNAELSEIKYNEETKEFDVGGYTFIFFNVSEIGMGN